MPDMKDLENEAEKEVKAHPQDVKKAEQEAEKEAEKEFEQHKP